MLKAFYSSATGMRAQEMLIDNTANNLANVNTTAFKRSHIKFADLLYDTPRAPGSSSIQGQFAPIGLQIGNGTREAGTSNEFTQGTLNPTGIKSHAAIEGEGFFKIALPSGEFRYTRDGSFSLNNQGQLVTSDGFLVEPAIQLPPELTDTISIGPSGEIGFTQNGVYNVVGQLQLFRFANNHGLQNMGGNMYAQTDASGQEIPGLPQQLGFGTLRQGYTEGSNVEVVAEMVSLITAQRAYEINSRAIRAGDEMLSNTSQLVR